MKKYTTYFDTKYMYTLSIPLEKTYESYKFIKMNSDYRHNVWNDFVERIREIQDKYGIKTILNMKYDYINMCKKKYFNEIEVPNHVYETYCVGISEQIAKDMKYALSSVKGNAKHRTPEALENQKFHFHKYDRYKGSFKVHNKPTFTDGGHSTRIHILDDNKFNFRIRCGCRMNFKTKEPIYTDMEYDHDNKDHTYYNEKRGIKFKRSDIKEIGFKYEGKCIYVILIMYVQYTMKDRDDRYTYAGIDTGIHNPVVLYHPIDDNDIDSDRNYEVYRFPEKVDRKIQHLLKRIKGVQHQMDVKHQVNKERVKMGELKNIYTKSYVRLLRKFRRLWKKVVNIKRDWRLNITNRIASSHKYIYVDKFMQPSIKVPHVNNVDRYHCMYLFNDVLEHMCHKTQTGYMSSVNLTTNICSKCGTSLLIPMSLSQRTFQCINPNCNYTRDRDFNAARNCCILVKNYCENLTEE